MILIAFIKLSVLESLLKLIPSSTHSDFILLPTVTPLPLEPAFAVIPKSLSFEALINVYLYLNDFLASIYL